MFPLANLGAGIAPWNIAQYRLIKRDNYGPITLRCRNREVSPLFYHFQGLTYIDERTVKTNTFTSWCVSKKLVYTIYTPYLKHIGVNKKKLEEKYGIKVIIKSHPGVEVKEKKAWWKRINFSTIRSLYYHGIPRRLSQRLDTISF